nr:glutathione transferase gst 23 [Quercus suber]
MAELKLFRTWSSRFALRVVWALNFKGIQYDTIFEDLSNKSSLLLQYNPIYKKVPVLVHNGKPLLESLVILEYIDETWKQNPLLPEDPSERATARFWAKFGDDKVLPSIWNAFIKQGKDQEEAIVTAQENLGFVERQLTGKKFFNGETIGLLDLAFGWLANLPSVLEEVLPSIWNAFIKQGKDQEEAIVTAQENLGFVERQLTGKKFFNGETIGLLDLAFGWLANLLSVLEEVSHWKLTRERAMWVGSGGWLGLDEIGLDEIGGWVRSGKRNGGRIIFGFATVGLRFAHHRFATVD